MRIRAFFIFLLPALSVAAIGFWRATRTRATSAAPSASYSYRRNWNPEVAASYLDYREVWWQHWPPTQKDHGTICISCHTVVPYALARPALQRQIGETRMPAPEKTMMDSVEKRVANWSETSPFYSDAEDGPGKTAQSHATEAVLNAVILASYDAGQGHLRPITRTAFDEAWALQEKTGKNAGGWKWQDFDLAPWESKESGYQGAALLAVALENAPDRYADEPGIREHLRLLQEYLQRQYAAQPVMSQLYVLWASARMPGLLIGTERAELMKKIERLQQSDGGWALLSLDEPTELRRVLSDRWKFRSRSAESDGCATGLIVLALEESGVSPQDNTLKRGLEWLQHHQQKDGSWRGFSLNAQRDPESDVGRFMTDAATGYAVLALETAQKEANRAGTL